MSASHTINRKRKQNKAKQKNSWLNNFLSVKKNQSVDFSNNTNL